MGTITPAAGALRARWEPAAKVRGYVALTKPRIIELLLVTTLPTMVLARHGIPGIGLAVATLAGGTLAAAGANAYNMVADRDIDAVMHRTRNRPLVTGTVSVSGAIMFATLLELCAVALLGLAVNWLSALLALSATLFYVFVYTLWLKRTSTQNIVIGGAAGAVPVLVGWAAVTDRLSWAPLLLAGVIFLWTPPHFWSLAVRYRDDYSAANVPMLPAVRSMQRTGTEILVYSVATVALTLALAPVAHLGWLYDVVAAAAGVVFVGFGVALRRRPGARLAMRCFGFSITYLTLLFMAIAADVAVHRL